MRFLIKTAFWLGLIAFFLPSGSLEDPSSHGIDTVTALLGVQEAASDLGGFCERSPMACEAGGQIAAFVGARVADGVGFAIHAARSSLSDGAPAEVKTAATTAAPFVELETDTVTNAGGPRPYQRPNAAATDPMATAAVAAAAVRRAVGMKPSAQPTVAQPLAAVPAATRAVFVPAVPTPAPRA